MTPKPVKFSIQETEDIFRAVRDLPTDEELTTAGTYDYGKVDEQVEAALRNRSMRSTR